ncbi:MBL fold metallo-hydrolase [Salinirubellus salinus]|uniref:MBL fold metallo-hydrolase n=1 Tax=Salinirubellus salinus TaxID=1364945 RepID=A0A9E7R6K2_9EURY|nr:MBL fold metallo-hydrolase [Salinirubellus salinus]UWM56856.1 MBL fold metallo-hydrolase [Salinirubellus salinus]
MGHVTLGNFAFEGLNNCYVLGLEPDATTTLVDTGDAYPATEAELRDGLADLGLEFADVERVFLTHWHEDHTGLAGTVQEESGASVHVHEADAPLVSGDEDARAAMRERMESMLARWGMPDASREELLGFMDGTEASGDPPEVTPFAGGERFDLGSVTLEPVPLPGHAAGLSGFTLESDRGTELFSGDALLPYYTPNVGGADVRVEGALAAYLETLTGIVEADYARAWPGHRGAIVDPAGRAADIVAHHRHRTERVVDVLRDGPADPWTVSAELFGDLSSIHILHGPGESHAHLEHLESAGVVAGSGTPREYELVEPEPDLDALFPDVGYAPEELVADD